MFPTRIGFLKRLFWCENRYNFVKITDLLANKCGPSLTGSSGQEIVLSVAIFVCKLIASHGCRLWIRTLSKSATCVLS